ncbi:MAG: M23 family metallopeptidase, partial [Acidobacteriota bacterium]
ISQGGCELVTYRVGATTQRDGVQAGSWWFPGYPLPGGEEQDRFALFAAPYDMNTDDILLIAVDDAGNRTEKIFIDRFNRKSFKSDTITISDSFMAKVVPEILAQSPEIEDRGNPLENYLAINRELRLKNAETIKALAQKSQPEFLWSESFLMLPNSKVTATFGEKRTYRYQGRTIDHQTHLGYDFASTSKASIPSPNDGIVVLARFLGIYGNTVVIDHGCGLMSICGHLSSIAVKEGQRVSRGDSIGKTGSTGLAGGDHLHFSNLLQGLPVNPIEWSDAHWIEDRITRKLVGASER